MGKPLHRDLESVKTFWREQLEKGSAKEKMRAVLHLERIAMEELKHRRSAKIQKAKAKAADNSPLDLASDPEPISDPFDQDPNFERKHDEWLARHPEMIRLTPPSIPAPIVPPPPTPVAVRPAPVNPQSAPEPDFAFTAAAMTSAERQQEIRRLKEQIRLQDSADQEI